MKDKKTKCNRYKKLVEDIQNCHCCEAIKIPIYESKGECLSNVDKEKYPEMNQVNMWNYWQGSLDADIMMLGQDFGTLPKRASDRENQDKKEKGYFSFEECINGVEWRTPITDEKAAKKHWGATDANIWNLFHQTFEMNVTEEQDKLFFTNMACCYRQNVISGNTNFRPEWLTLCANKYMGRLIDIIEPEIIIALGENVFRALDCIEHAKLVCINNDVVRHQEEDSAYEKTMRYEYELVLESGKRIRVFPVYHPGAYSTVNRPMYEADIAARNKKKNLNKSSDSFQMSDWQKIASYYNEKKK